MALTGGMRLGPYEIGAPLGAGGMGEVYRARDTRLGREVAIKALPDGFANDSERVARFQREAQLLGSLNHPNIGGIHGIEEQNGACYLVLEYVPGDGLDARLKCGPLPVDETLEVCRQIAEALEAAHEKGIVHRDLKPANIKTTPEGKVKVLDFGLAKDVSAVARTSDLTSGPTEIHDSPAGASPAYTRAGMILGTAAYMSPEQARGKLVDKRSDIWAFGCILYECLTGQQAFGGETVSDTVAAILKTEPAWSPLPSNLPPAIHDLLRRCLQKDVRNRLRDAGDARIELEEALAHPASLSAAVGATLPKQPAPWRGIVPWALMVVLSAGLFVLGWLLFRKPAATPVSVCFTISPPPGQQFGDASGPIAAFSANGDRLVLVLGRGEAGQLYLRRMDQIDIAPIAGTKGAKNPFFSPDGKWVGFTANHKLQKVAIQGGPPIVLCDAEWGGGAWAADDTIIYTQAYQTGLWRIPAGGGEPKMLTSPDAANGELGHWWPQILPGGKWVLFTIYLTARPRIAALSLETGERRVLIEEGTFARYVPTGHIVYVRGETLMAAPFDASEVRTTGSPVPVLDDMPVELSNANSQFSLSETGNFAYIPASAISSNRQLVWVDRRGIVQPIIETARGYSCPRLSPDGRRMAVAINEKGQQDVWVYDLERGSMTRFTFGAGAQFNPIWTPDGKRLVYDSEKLVYEIYATAADRAGSEEPLSSGPYDRSPSSFTADGKALAFTEGNPKTGSDIWLLSMEGERKARPFVQTPFVESNAAFSPDGRWLAYQSNESGRNEVYVQAYPGPGGRWQVSTDGGAEPVWARSGREIFYRNADKMMAVSVSSQTDFKVGKPVLLFEGTYEHFYNAAGYDVAPDGQRFVMVRSQPNSIQAQVIVIMNWFEELKRHAK